MNVFSLKYCKKNSLLCRRFVFGNTVIYAVNLDQTQGLYAYYQLQREWH